MTQDKTITLYQWILMEFVTARRAESMQELVQPLSAIVQPGDRVLDLCCGTGDVALGLSARGGRVVGLDFSQAMLAIAQACAFRLPIFS